MAGGKYYYRVKEYLRNYEIRMREKGFARHTIFAKPEQWGAILTFAREIKKLRFPEKIVGLDVTERGRCFRVVMKDSVHQTDEEFFNKNKPNDYSDIPFLEEGQEINPEIEEYVKNRRNR